LSLVLNRVDADEVYQETSAVLWTKFGEFQTGTNFFAWARQIALFEVYRFRASRQRSGLSMSDEFIEIVSQKLAAMEGELERRHEALEGCLAKLDRQGRDLVSRRYHNEQPVKQIADQLGRSVHAVYRALDKLHQSLFDCIERTLAREVAP
jgi:RNA polymerase sigma-70 factor (ECF subfamily)